MMSTGRIAQKGQPRSSVGAAQGVRTSLHPAALRREQLSLAPALLPMVAQSHPSVCCGASRKISPPGATAVADFPTTQSGSGTAATTRKLKVLIAGAGIGGMVLAVALLKQGVDVEIFERDVTAVRGEGKYRGPIQVQSNALAALEAIDQRMAAEIMAEGCMTGDRVNGLCDGLTGEWYVKFDMYHLAVDNGLPVTRVISRITLQQRLQEAVQRLAPNAIQGACHVTSFAEGLNPTTGEQGVSITLENGRTVYGDMLVGADGIWSKVRKQLIGDTTASYSEYTCYTGISDFTPADIDVVGYRVFLGNGKYFVSSDVGGGKMQWYAFNKEAEGGTDKENRRKERLLDIFGTWSHHTKDLIKATPEEDIMRRDIFDRPPILNWAKGRVALLGDSAHAMQPNLGQGGCMAIEDAYALALDLGRSVQLAGGDATKVPVEQVLRSYQNERCMRVGTIHGMAGMAAIMASTYKAYLGEGLGPLRQLLEPLKIPHPGRVAGQLMMNLTMPSVLGWVLGGNMTKLSEVRPAACLLTDKPKTFDESRFPEFLADDDAIVRAINADWLLISERSSSVAAVDLAEACSSTEAKGVYIVEKDTIIGRSNCGLVLDTVAVADRHARVWRDKDDSSYYLQCLGAPSGTFINGSRMASLATRKLRPSDEITFGSQAAEKYQIKLQHVSLRNTLLKGDSYTVMLLGKKLLQQVAQQTQSQDGAAALV